jgi:hypothetical protein
MHSPHRAAPTVEGDVLLRDDRIQSVLEEFVPTVDAAEKSPIVGARLDVDEENTRNLRAYEVHWSVIHATTGPEASENTALRKVVPACMSVSFDGTKTGEWAYLRRIPARLHRHLRERRGTFLLHHAFRGGADAAAICSLVLTIPCRAKFSLQCAATFFFIIPKGEEWPSPLRGSAYLLRGFARLAWRQHMIKKTLSSSASLAGFAADAHRAS